MSKYMREQRYLPERQVLCYHVPWYNKEEFVEVYQGLFSKSLFQREKAVRKVSVWESRSHPALLAGICATAAFVNAQIRDDMMQMGMPCTLRSDDFRLMYCTALTRFTNFVGEVGQLGQQDRTSLRRAAAKVSIPEWIVDLRHRATHRKLPALQNLRDAAVFCMAWLEKQFWKKELSSFVDYNPVQPIYSSQIQDIFSSYLSIQYNLLIGDLNKNDRQREKNQLRGLLMIMEPFARSKSKLFIKTLVSPGLFLHSAADLGALLDNGKLFIIENTVNLPDRIVELWKPVIKILCTSNLLQQFLEALFECQNSIDELHQKLAASWCHFLIDTGLFYQVEFQDIPEENKPILNWVRLMAACAKYPSKYTPRLLLIIVEKINPPLDEMKKNLLMAMVAIHTGATVPDDIQPPPLKRQKFTVDDVRNAFTNEDPEKPKQKKSLFVPASAEMGWESIPLGIIFSRNPPVEIVVEEKEKPSEAKPAEAESKKESESSVAAKQEELGLVKEEEEPLIQQESATLFQISDVYSGASQNIPVEDCNFSETVIMYPVMS